MTDYDELHDELERKTTKELRQIARDEGICLGYDASRKSSMVNAIVSGIRYREAHGYD